ncbi:MULTISPECIES: entry exclusion lipoprotein TrbK [Massilia]|nr:entry exclusion lipoprotein TrbK [Massilia sp. H27-R4]
MKQFKMLAKSLLAVALSAAVGTASADSGRNAQYWLDHPVERTAKLKECQVDVATTTNSPDCVSAGQAAAAALGRGKPVYVGAPPAPSVTSLPPPDDTCKTEALKAIHDKAVREDMAAACIRRGTFKPTPKTRTW